MRQPIKEPNKSSRSSHSSIELRERADFKVESYFQSQADILRPDTAGQSVHCVVSQRDSLFGRSEGENREDGSEYLLLHDLRHRLHVGYQRGRVEAAFTGDRGACLVHLAQLEIRTYKPNSALIMVSTSAPSCLARSTYVSTDLR